MYVNNNLSYFLSQEWSQSNIGGLLSSWIKSKVIPAYTVASVNYCKSLPGTIVLNIWFFITAGVTSIVKKVAISVGSDFPEP